MNTWPANNDHSPVLLKLPRCFIPNWSCTICPKIHTLRLKLLLSYRLWFILVGSNPTCFLTHRNSLKYFKFPKGNLSCFSTRLLMYSLVISQDARQEDGKSVCSMIHTDPGRMSVGRDLQSCDWSSSCHFLISSFYIFQCFISSPWLILSFLWKPSRYCLLALNVTIEISDTSFVLPLGHFV